MRTDLLDIIDNGPGGLILKRKILRTIPINCALQPIDSTAKYSVKDPDPYSGTGRVNLIRIRNAGGKATAGGYSGDSLVILSGTLAFVSES